uniref:Uncharacterized protein n=1 Tax=viral metagenome TaxID=1070528 RepID=A0A6M3L5C6_9ZZZZ
MKKGIIIPIVLALVAVFLVGGVVYAAYNFWSGTAQATVQESMAVWVDGAWQPTGTYTWTETMSPGESKVKPHTVRNNGTASLGIMPVATPAASADGKVTATWNPAVKTTIAGVTQTDFVLTIQAAGDAVPAVYTFTTSFTRENP